MADKSFKVGDPVHAPKTVYGNGKIMAIRDDDIVVRFACGMISGWDAEELAPGHVEQHKMPAKARR